MLNSLYLTVSSPGQAGEMRRQAVSWAMQNGCVPEDTAQLALAVSELAGNLSLHTSKGGGLVLRLLSVKPLAFELLSLDKGPGMPNFAACLRDGYSTAGTAGTGLGAVHRASTVFDVHTRADQGTVIMSRVYQKPEPAVKKDGLGLVNIPKKGETACGDACGFRVLDHGRACLMIADGLGHGPLAQEASRAAVRAFNAERYVSLADTMERVHLALKPTRGAAVAIAELDASQECVTYTGVGNIAGTILTVAKPAHMVSMNGTMGVGIPHIRMFKYPWKPGSTLVMNSDGLKTQWQLDAYAGIMEKHPALIAGVLFRDFSRDSDDVTVAALRWPYEHRN
jgi:anti-sigma regulatory factor (Ser/Thr protein kinase)